MAAGGPVRELCEEASCSICLDYFRDPVTIPECGHSFCRACLTRSWGEPGAEPSCPHCRGRAQEGSLRPNRQLANFVEIAKKFALQEGKEAVGTAGKGEVCQKHEEPLKLFCKDDGALICVVCDRSKEHRNHKTLPLEEASQEYQDQFRNCLKILKKERERILAYEGDVVKESQELLKQTTGKKQETVAKFRQLRTFLEEQEKLLLARMEEVEKEVARKMDQYLAKLSEALFSIESLIWEMEKKCEQSARDLLQDVRSTLQRYEEKETFENPVTFPLALKWKIWDVRDISHFLEGVMKQLKDALDSGLRMKKALPLGAAMASGGPVKELCEEVSCSICLDYFRDPVMIPECGHNFCRACLARSWGEFGSGAACPQCRGKAQEGSLRPNHQLANIVEIAKKFTLQEAKETGGNGQLCPRHQELLRSSCKDDEAPLCKMCGIAEEHQEAAGKGGVCQKHQEPLKLFCKDDRALICVVCDRSKEHRDHLTLPLEEASQEYQDQFRNCLEILKKEREGILAFKGAVEKESQDLLKQVNGEKQETVAMFRQLRTFLEEQEGLLLAQMEEVEKEATKKRDQSLAELSETLSSLESLIREMEEKCQQPAGDLLQDARTTLQKYEERESFENPVAFPLALKWHIWDFSDFNLLWEGIWKQFKDTLDSGPYQKANVTLDPDTAHPRLILSEGQKSVRAGEKAQALPNNPERFEQRFIVLGREGFRAGRHFWEVLVGSEEEWLVGVARKSVRRKGEIRFSPEEGIWAMGKLSETYKAYVNNHYPPETQTKELKRIQVCLNYTGGRVAFFDPDTAALLYEFSGASFPGETLLPFFWVCSKGHLTIFP